MSADQHLGTEKHASWPNISTKTLEIKESWEQQLIPIYGHALTESNQN
jgi:hypothetical protein